MEPQLAALFEALRGSGTGTDSMRREDVDEISTITGMSMKASRKLLRKYRGSKDDALLAWYDKDVDSSALEAASDSEAEEEVEVSRQVDITCDWPLFPDVVEWITSTSGCLIDLAHVRKPKDPLSLVPAGSSPGEIHPPEVLNVRVPVTKKAATPEEEEKEIFTCLSIGQPVRVRRYVKEMKQSRAGWKEDTEFDQKRLCGRLGIIKAVMRRDLTARVEFNGFGSGWWDIRWLEILPQQLCLPSAAACSGYAKLRGDSKQVKLALRCIAQLTTCVRTGSLDAFLGPVSKAVEQVVPISRGEVVWRSLLQPDGEILGYQLCICDPRAVGPVARCIEGEMTWNLDKQSAVSEEVVTRVAKLARAKTGCVVVSAPKGETKMDAGAIVIRNPRCWVGGNADGLEGHRVAPGVVLGCDHGRAQVFWMNSNAVATHRWGFDDTYDFILMPCFIPVGRLLLVLVGIDRIPGLTWEMLVNAARESLTMEGANIVRQALKDPAYKWNGETFANKIDTGKLARSIVDLLVDGWEKDGVLPPPLVSDDLTEFLGALQGQAEPVGGHLGIWREAKVTVHQFYCSNPSRREGPICQHPGGAIQTPHWSCCGQQSKMGFCRQTEVRDTPLHEHTLRDWTMSIMSWVCDRCKVKADPQQGQRWRCDTCDYDLCDPCLHDSLREICKQHIEVQDVDCSSFVVTSVMDTEIRVEQRGAAFVITPAGSKPRIVKEVVFTHGDDGAQPIITFSDPDGETTRTLTGGVHGYFVGQAVHATKDIYVSVSVAVQQGCHGVVVGPSTSGDPRRVCVKFLGRDAKINVMPLEVKQLLESPRRAKVHNAGKPVLLRKDASTASAVAGEVACGSEVQVLEDGKDYSLVDSSDLSGFVANSVLRELNTQSTVVMLNTRGLGDAVSAIRSIARATRVKCNIPSSFDLTVGGRVPAIVVGGLQGDMESLNGVYRRAPGEEDCRVIFRKGSSTLYFRGSWWKLNNKTRHDGWLQSSRGLVGQWSPANTQDARTDVPYPCVMIGRLVTKALEDVPAPTEVVLPEGVLKGDPATNTVSFQDVPIQAISYHIDTAALHLAPLPPLALTVTNAHSVLAEVRALCRANGVPCSIASEIEVVESVDVSSKKVEKKSLPELAALSHRACQAVGGAPVTQLLSRFGWDGSTYTDPVDDTALAQVARQLHELVGEKMTADVSCGMVAPRSMSVAVVGPMPGRQRAKGFLSRLHDLQEVAIRVPSENHAVVERHRYEIQKHAHTHMNVGFGGAIVRLTGTAAAIRHTRRAVATLLMKHWREQQRQRREVVLEQVVASAMEVRISVSLSDAMVELLSRKEPNEPDSQRRHDEAEAERRLDEQRLISMTQELSREYERLANSCRGQLSSVGMTNVALCHDDFTRGDRVERGPTWQWGDQDGGPGSTGTVMGVHDEDGWVVVEWDKSGKLTRHRTGPLYQDLQHLEEVKLPVLLEEAQSDLVNVLKARTATHMSRSLDFLRKGAVCKLSWADEEYRQRGIVHEARMGVKDLEAAEKFQSWLRDLFSVKERAAEQMTLIQKEMASDRDQMDETLRLISKWEGEQCFDVTHSAETAASGELCVCIVTEDQLYGMGNTPFDVCSRKSIARHSRIRLKNDVTVNDCLRAVEKQLGVPPERQRLWYFSIQPMGTFRPSLMLRPSDDLLLSACTPPPHTPGEVQLLVELLSDVPTEPQDDTVVTRIVAEEPSKGVPFRASRDSQPKRQIPDGTEVQVVEEDGEWVRVAHVGEEGFVQRRHVTKVPAGQNIIFLKRFNAEDAAVERLGFRVVDVSKTTAADMCASVNAEYDANAEDPLDVYVEETPERVRKLADLTIPLKDCSIRSGAVLVFQTPPPAVLSRPLKVGDTVVYTGPSHKSSILHDSGGSVTSIITAQSLVKVTSSRGEAETFQEKWVALDPKSVGLPYDHATVPAIYSFYISRKDLPPLNCKSGHLLSRIDNPRRLVCSYCQAPGATELAFWGCTSCDHHLCLLCAIETRISTKMSPELSPRQKPGSKFKGSKLSEMLSEHLDRGERLWQSLRKHRSQLDGTVSEVLMHVRRMGEQRQHRRLFGWDLLLHLMDTTGCLLELTDETLAVVGRPFAVRKAMSAIDAMQRDWPPQTLPTEARVDVGEQGVDKLFSRAGIMARSLQFECGLQDVQPIDDSLVWLCGKRENVQHAADRLKVILGRAELHLEWADTGTSEVPESSTNKRCPVCLDDVSPTDDDVTQLLCRHMVHTDCGGQYLTAHQHEKDSLPCMESGCSYVMRVSEYAALADGHSGLRSPEEYYDNQLREALLKHDKVVACPFEGCNGWAVTGNVVGTVENLHCFECDRLFCPICRQLGHFFSQCEEVAEAAKVRAGAERKQKLEQEEQSRKAIAELCRPCPRCGAQVSRTEGCPHMTCKVCKFEFCYDCLRAIPHFGECDKSKLADRMRRVRAEHGGVMFHKYTKCDVCQKHPIPDSEDAFTCLNCLHWSICGTCEKQGKNCGYDGHILSVLPRSDEPPAEAVFKGEKQKWRLKLDEIPCYEIDWDIVRNKQTPLTASSAAAGEGEGRLDFEKQVSNKPIKRGPSGIGLNLATPLNGDWGNGTRTSSLLGQPKDLGATLSGTIGKADTILFEWEESELDSGSDSSYQGGAPGSYHSDADMHALSQHTGDGSMSDVVTASLTDEEDDALANHHDADRHGW